MRSTILQTLTIITALNCAPSAAGQEELSPAENNGYMRARWDQMTLALDVPCDEIWQGLRFLAWLPIVKANLPENVAARTYADEEWGPAADPLEYEWNSTPGNEIAISDEIMTAGGEFEFSFSSQRLNDAMMMAVLYGESGHQDLVSYKDKKGKFIDNPTPGGKTAAQNKECWDDSEIEVAERAVQYIDWLLECNEARDGNGDPYIEMQAKDKILFEYYKGEFEKQKRQHGG